MKRKILVLFLIGIIGYTFFKVKNKYSLKNSDSQFIILNWSMTPSYFKDTDRPITFIFHIKDRQNKPIMGAKISIEANTIPPSPSALFADAIEDRNGFYKTNFKLSSQGTWILYLIIKKANGDVIKKELSFSNLPRK